MRLALAALLACASTSAAAEPPPVTVELSGNKHFLVFPAVSGAPKQRVRIEARGKLVREFEMELADGPGVRLFPVDVHGLAGPLTVRATGGPVGMVRATSVEPADDTPSELRRPLAHFTAKRGWLNDPNGLVYENGTWHLFFQHNPYGTAWGNMHWGHAVSKDLVRWQELPIALTPPRWDDFAFSGSAVVDAENTSGFGKAGQPPLVAAFTSTGRGECVAYSTDRGRTWAEYGKNPVVKHQGRDPKLVRDRAAKAWVMAVYDEKENGKDQGISFYTSPDLKAWTYRSRVGGYFECPDLLELPVQGHPPGSAPEFKHVLYGADGKYQVGHYRDGTFTPDGPKQTLWHGNFYAAQTFANAPDGRCVQVGWARGIDTPKLAFNQQMTIPVDLTLRLVGGKRRLVAEPVKEFAAACGPAKAVTDYALAAGEPAVLAESLEAGDVRVELAGLTAGAAVVRVRGVEVRVDPKAGTLAVGKLTAPVAVAGGRVSLRLVVDRQSVEVFTPDGTAVSVGAPPGAGPVTVAAEGAAAVLARGSAAALAGR